MAIWKYVTVRNRRLQSSCKLLYRVTPTWVVGIWAPAMYFVTSAIIFFQSSSALTSLVFRYAGKGRPGTNWLELASVSDNGIGEGRVGAAGSARGV